MLDKTETKVVTPANPNNSLKEIKLSLGRMEKKITDKMFESRE